MLPSKHVKGNALTVKTPASTYVRAGVLLLADRPQKSMHPRFKAVCAFGISTLIGEKRGQKLLEGAVIFSHSKELHAMLITPAIENDCLAVVIAEVNVAIVTVDRVIYASLFELAEPFGMNEKLIVIIEHHKWIVQAYLKFLKICFTSSVGLSNLAQTRLM